MKIYVSLVVFAVLAAGATCTRVRFPASFLKYEPEIPLKRSSRVDLPEQWLDQRVDNFNPQNLDTFQTRYYENDEFFAPFRALFIYIGGEWEINQGSILGGHIYDMAAEFQASLFYPEHRYYGKSFPADNLNVTNLRFLTVEQALADLANFVQQIKRQPRYARSPVFVVGASYAATMAVWFRQLYPHLTIGAWASSAPVNAQVDFIEYKELVGAALYEHGSQACYNRLENAFAAAEQLIRDNQTEEFRQLFGYCEGFGTELDVWSAFSLMSNILAGPVQYHRNNAIGITCDEIMNTTTQPSTDLSEFARYFRSIFKMTDSEYCLENYENTVAFMLNSSLTSDAVVTSSRQWYYQTCTEFGWYQTSGSEHQPFGSSFPVDLYVRYCNDIFGDLWTNATIHDHIDRKNVAFGSWNSAVTNVYFTHGLVDPWRTMGIQEDLNPSSPADVIPGASHCQDLGSISESDSAEMLAVKRRVTNLVRMWLLQNWLGNLAVPY